jgi:hypothetical protein
MMPLVPRGQPPESWGDEGPHTGHSFRAAFKGSLGLCIAIIVSGAVLFVLVALVRLISH